MCCGQMHRGHSSSPTLHPKTHSPQSTFTSCVQRAEGWNQELGLCINEEGAEDVEAENAGERAVWAKSEHVCSVGAAGVGEKDGIVTRFLENPIKVKLNLAHRVCVGVDTRADCVCRSVAPWAAGERGRRVHGEASHTARCEYVGAFGFRACAPNAMPFTTQQ